MTKPLAKIDHWTGTKILVTAAAPETGIATLHVMHDEITLNLSVGLNESELRTLRDGADRALALMAKKS